MKRDSIPRDIYDRVESELLVGEQLLWVGLPSARVRMTGDSGRVVMTLTVGMMTAGLLAGILVFMLSARSAVVWSGMTGIILLMIVAVAMLSAAPLVRKYLQRRGTVYAVTDRRALILAGTSVQSYGHKDIDFIERRMRGTNRGDIIFKREARVSSAYYGNGLYGSRDYNVPIGFFGIENPREVEALMLETFRPDERTSVRRQKPKRLQLDDPEAFADTEFGTQAGDEHLIR